MHSSHICVQVDLGRVWRNTADIAARVNAPIFATIKADAYGLGAARVAVVIRDLVAGWSLFSLDEARSPGAWSLSPLLDDGRAPSTLWELTGRPAITLGPPSSSDPAPWIEQRVRPAVSTIEQALMLKRARPILCVDTGMQRFGCPPEQIDAVIAAGEIDEAFTHATHLEHIQRLRQLVGGKVARLHAAASALLDEPAAWLDAVRPGMALYRGAVLVSTPLAETHRSRGPLGYTGWTSPTGCHGVIVAGYASGLRPGPVLINGRPQRITEVGMQSAYVTTDPCDKPGDPVVLLGAQGEQVITESDIAAAQASTPQESLLRMASMGVRHYTGRPI